MGFKPRPKCPACGSTTHHSYHPDFPCGWQEDQIVPRNGHGLDGNTRFALLQAIAEFQVRARMEFSTAELAHNNCNYASDEFLHLLDRFGIEGLIEHYNGDNPEDLEDYPYEELYACSYHWAVRVGNLIIDWTARQFSEQAGLPAVWVSEPRPWRNVTD